MFSRLTSEFTNASHDHRKVRTPAAATAAHLNVAPHSNHSPHERVAVKIEDFLELEVQEVELEELLQAAVVVIVVDQAASPSDCDIHNLLLQGGFAAW